jgi:DNA mismatch repair protein MutL
VRVTDDGTGMNRDDALLCLERHATSKIRAAADLHAITTMGFRGEALPSIASVSRFTLTTRERDHDAPEGTQVVVAGGRIAEVKAAGCAPGTVVEVRQLFYNLPARRKFLRSDETERAHVQHYLTLAALAHPQVAFTFVHDGRTIWQLPAVAGAADRSTRLEALRERLRALLGGDLALVAVEYTVELAGGEMESESDSAIHIWGWLGAPGVSRSTRQDQSLFVNRRPVDNRGLNHALLEGYHTALMKGRYPVCCLFLEIDAGEVDVNIHPAKREVKFHRERDVRRHVAEAVRQALLGYHADQQRDADVPPTRVTPPQPATPTKLAPAGPQPAELPLAGLAGPAPRPSVEQRSLPMGFARPPQPSPSQSGVPSGLISSRTDPAKRSGADAPLTRPAGTLSPHPMRGEGRGEGSPPMPTGDPAPLLAVPLRVVGVIGRLYVVLESDRGLVLMDQHAAHERILFEQMLARMERAEAAPSQRLLLPETVEVPPRDAQFLREQLATLQRLGVGLSEFGERTFLLDALPPFAKAPDARQFVLELIDELKAAGQSVNTLRLGEHTVAKTVCRHAVKANDPLQGPELEKLLDDLRRCEMPYTCPHGRPTLIEMSLKELEKRFGRVQ